MRLFQHVRKYKALPVAVQLILGDGGINDYAAAALKRLHE